MNSCICCHHRLLRHLNHSRVYWFCPNCHQEMPKIEALLPVSAIKTKSIKANQNHLVSTIK